MKCPKCGYLGFETTDRCRNCQYDFSLAPFASEQELTLHGAEHKREGPSDFDLPPMLRQSDTLSATALDLDRLFGEPEPPKSIAAAEPEALPAMRSTAQPADDVEAADEEPDIDADMSDEPAMAMAFGPQDEVEPGPDAYAIDEAALPFDDAPLTPPPAARTPLAVRRSTPEVPRNRSRTTRPARMDALDFEAASTTSSESAAGAAGAIASLVEMPSLGVRVGAGLIDLALLVGIDATVLYLTLRVTGLGNTVDDLRVLPPIPFIGFLAMLSFGYVAAFTVGGGQTIGKMALNLRVIGDDGRPVDAAGGMLRALGCMLVPVTLGLSYLPAFFTSDHRALHDRIAGTRVVQE
jgi:uncharacterized RDD family membrane protein YckC